MGLLIRFTSLGKPYYLVPDNLVSGSLLYIKSKAEEISKIIEFHRKKYMKESQKVGLLTHTDDLIISDLSFRFPDHQFIVIDSFEKLRSLKDTFDLIILPRDFYEIVLMEKFNPRQKGIPRRQVTLRVVGSQREHSLAGFGSFRESPLRNVRQP